MPADAAKADDAMYDYGSGIPSVSAADATANCETMNVISVNSRWVGYFLLGKPVFEVIVEMNHIFTLPTWLFPYPRANAPGQPGSAP